MRTHIHWSRVLPLVVILSLAIAAFSPTLVQAEGDVPETTPPVAPTEPQPGASAETPVETIVQVLADNGAQLAGEDGAIPLASQSALTILCDADPWFYCLNCTGGQSPAYPTIAEAVFNWVNLKGVGMIYLEGNHTYPEAVDLDGTAAGFSTLKGIVWDNSGTTKPVIADTVSIYGFAGGFTLQGIQILTNTTYYGLDIYDNKGLLKLVDLAVTNTGGSGGYIDHKGSVEMLRVDVSHNYEDGLTLNTCGWSDWDECSISGTLKLTDSSFSYNGNSAENLWGLWINTRNPITINGFSAIGNKGDGLDIEAYGGAVIIKNAVFKDTTLPVADPAYGFGLWVYEESFSNITLENVVATANANDGLYIGTSGVVTIKNVTSFSNAENGLRIAGDISGLTPSARSVAITNSRFFDNDKDNLFVSALGPITLTGVSALHSNNEGGAYLDNSTSIIPTPVTITSSSFSDNQGAGLKVLSKGNITLNTITASRNNSHGVFLDNFTFTGATGGITMLASFGVNTIQSNGTVDEDGLQINTTRNIILNKLNVSSSTGDGINIENAGLTTNLLLNDVSSWGNDGWGIAAEVGGTITWNRGGAWDNGQDPAQFGGGAELRNYSSGLPKNITLKDVVFDNNLGADGLSLDSLGSITLTNISASGNTAGAGIYFEAPIGKGGNFIILRTKPEGYNTINGNGLEGLFVFTRGSITLNRVQVNDNFSQNAYLDTCQGLGACQGAGAVIIKGTSSFPVQFNGSKSNEGMFINAAGNITLSGIQVNQNNLHGLDAISVNGSVSVLGTGNQFNQNGQDLAGQGGGVIISAKGNITLMNFTAEENDWKGVLLDNHMGTGNVTITATAPYFINRVYDNTDKGIEILSSGIVLINKVNVEDNDKGGLFIYNETASIPKPVSVISSTFIGNQVDDGLYISSKGAITLNMVTASMNWMYGASLDNTAWTTSALPVSVTKSSFNYNVGTGLFVKATGPITLNSVSGLINNNPGAQLDNSNSPVNSPITLIGTNNFSGNTGSGLWIKSKGAVSISGVTAAHNQERGIDIDQAGTIMLVSSQVLNNSNEGVYSTSVGNTTVRNLLAFLNGAVGHLPGMDMASISGKIYLYSSTATGNDGYGFRIYVPKPKLDFYMSLVNYMGNGGGTYTVEPYTP